MQDKINAILQHLSAKNDSFKGLLDLLFPQIQKIESSNSAIANLQSESCNFDNAIIYYSSAKIDNKLQISKSGHTNLAFSLIPTYSHKRVDLIKVTRKINEAITSYNVIFFLSSTHLSISFALRREHKITSNKDVLEKITLIKDIDLAHPSQAHAKNLESIAKITPKEVNKYYDEILEALSISALNKEFYKAIKSIFDSILATSHIPLQPQEQKEFTIKLLGRILFISFLKKLHIVPEAIFKAHKDYYQTILAPLFFEVLNTPMDKRQDFVQSNPLFADIPYLNGGLFSPSALDCYDSSDLEVAHIKIQDSIFESIFDLFQKYHFTIDEQSPFEQEVALDPEMLGQIFENLLAEIDPTLDDKSNVRKATGSFYTPRNIVSFMCKNALLQSLKSKLDSSLHSHLQSLIFSHDSQSLSKDNKAQILTTLNSLKILDLFCGSGAFPLGILQEIIALQEALDSKDNLYNRKLAIIQNQIYGVDIQPIATEISRLRCFLSLIIESNIDKSKPNCGITPLPNLEFKFISANSFIKHQVDKSKLDESYPQLIQSLKDIAKSYFTTTDSKRKSNLKQDFYAQRDSITDSKWLSPQAICDICAIDPFDDTKVAPFFDSGFMFGLDSFDICIGNPPYISTKGKAHQQNKTTLLAQDGFFDDAYNHAFFSAYHAISTNGIISLITSKSFWTISTKANLRKLILENALHFICDSANPFYSAMVDTCITQFAKSNSKLNTNNTIRFIDATKDFDNPQVYETTQSLYQNANAQVIFKPSPYNLALYKRFNESTKALMSQWWSKIDTSAKISKNHNIIQHYRDSLKEGDLTLLGLITDGGQGLATANNGRFIALRQGSKEAQRTKEARAEKLFSAK